jgi:Spy/CpxP family protein refolding chaperone
MKFKNKVLTGLLLCSVASTTLFANCQVKDGQKDCYKKSCQVDKKHHKKMKNMKNHREGHIFGLFKQLNLTDEQKVEIKKIMLESKQNQKNASDAFTKDSFDKKKYIEIISQKRENMLKSKAEALEKSYALLTSQQKEQLKVLMDLKQEKKESFLDKKMERISNK